MGSGLLLGAYVLDLGFPVGTGESCLPLLCHLNEGVGHPAVLRVVNLVPPQVRFLTKLYHPNVDKVRAGASLPLQMIRCVCCRNVSYS
jgi:hypothetical protein